MKKHIPNIITLGNLTCGLLAILSVFSETPHFAVYFIFGGLFLDFFDGFFARILKVDGELGKQLDSLADMVTFGVAPGFLMFSLLKNLVFKLNLFEYTESPFIPEYMIQLANENAINDSLWIYVPILAFLIPVLSAVRLAKFNIDTKQSDEFIGLPTPANAIFFSAIFMIFQEDIFHIDFEIENGQGIIFAIAILIAIFSWLLNAKIPLIALKFKSFGWKGNEVRFIFLGMALVAIITSLLISNIFVSIPIIILLYLFISIINNFTKKQNEI